MYNPDELTQICLKVFEGVSKASNWFVIPLFILRVSYAQMTGNAQEIKTAIRGVFIYFFLIYGFSYILSVLFTAPQAFLPGLDSIFSGSSGIGPGLSQGAESLNGKSVQDWGSIAHGAGEAVPILVTKILEFIAAMVYWFLVVIHVLFMVLMSGFAPIVFLLSCILGVGIGLRAFFGLLILAACWPLMWYGFDQALISISKTIPDSVGRSVTEIVVTLIKGVGPLGVAYLGVNSGLGSSTVSGARSILGAGESMTSGLSFAVEKISNNKFSNSKKDRFNPSGTSHAQMGESKTRIKNSVGRKIGTSSGGFINKPSKGFRSDPSKTGASPNRIRKAEGFFSKYQNESENSFAGSHTSTSSASFNSSLGTGSSTVLAGTPNVDSGSQTHSAIAESRVLSTPPAANSAPTSADKSRIENMSSGFKHKSIGPEPKIEGGSMRGSHFYSEQGPIENSKHGSKVYSRNYERDRIALGDISTKELPRKSSRPERGIE